MKNNEIGDFLEHSVKDTSSTLPIKCKISSLPQNFEFFRSICMSIFFSKTAMVQHNSSSNHSTLISIVVGPLFGGKFKILW